MVARAEQYTESHGWQNFSKGASATEKPKTTFTQPIQNSDVQPPAGTKRQPEKYCFLCSRSGHSTETAGTPPKESAASCIEDGFVELKNGEKVPVVNAGLTERSTKTVDRLPVVTGLAGGKEVRVLRDTGCNTVIVKTSLVKEEDFTGTKAPVHLLDRSVRMLAEAWIDVDTPCYSGRLKAKCIESPIYELGLGNVEGARPANDPDLYWRLPATQDVAGTNASQSTVQKPLTALVQLL
ncbi:hypothetical protein HPB50_013029 [Hyalomma asiaticum]|uniref:Uncharacterized protein n=1 Tax=Hyalomma asiaticum TaxID=266040 RepID=A0ACB7RZT6_HYAAI|nr:hypothetical protein HPB50_013029 [Hyalomma asiaticum]